MAREKLAINGGKRAVPEDFKVEKWPIIEKEEIFSLMKVLEKGDLSGTNAEAVVELEREYAEYVGVKHCIATNSGTSSLHTAIAACGIEPGDEVIVTAFTFVASALAIIHNLAIPIFVDIDPETYNMDLKKIEEKITDKTKAIMAVHFQGLPAEMDEINTIAKKYNLIVIEDGSQAAGAIYKGRKTGSLGDICGAIIISLKPLSSGGEGGLVTTDSDDYYEQAIKVRNFGEPLGKVLTYNALCLGYNYKIVPFCAAIARSQLRKTDNYTRLRQTAADYLSRSLNTFPGIKPPFVPSYMSHTYYAYRFRLDAKEAGLEINNGRFRKAIQDILVAEGVPVSHYQIMPVPSQKIFQEKIGFGRGYPWNLPGVNDIEYNISHYPQTLKAIEETLRFPPQDFPPLPPHILDVYINAFKKVFDNLPDVYHYSKSIDYLPPWESSRR